MKSHYTVGLAGHIDHGKTSLIKALTNIHTDRLIEEKKRAITIELGYAHLVMNESLTLSFIDVPGHERFIRQMIAGVVGIHFVILVVAADEGVMPQTKEHIEILQLLGITKGMIVITKIATVDDEIREIVELDIKEAIKDTFLENAPLFYVDSVTKDGINTLKAGLKKMAHSLSKRDVTGPFRLPIDQVFTIHGQGTIVRGTISSGTVVEGDMLTLLPTNKKVRARQLQVHQKKRKIGEAGERIAINVGGIDKEEIKRGDTLVIDDYYVVTQIVDVAFTFVSKLNYPVKQRMPIKLHIGTAEVYGKIVFFDRNEWTTGNTSTYCQLRLDEPIVTKRGDRFIIRRPSPMETIGGGTVIQEKGGTYRFGKETIAMLKQKEQFTPREQVAHIISAEKCVPVDRVAAELSLTKWESVAWITNDHSFVLTPHGVTTKKVIRLLHESIKNKVSTYHKKWPLRRGMMKAELISSLKDVYPAALVEWAMEQFEQITTEGPYVYITDFVPHPPKKWEKLFQQTMTHLKDEGLTVTPLHDLFNMFDIPKDIIQDMITYVQHEKIVYKLTESLFVHKEPFQQAVIRLKNETTKQFSLQDARKVLSISRKYLIPMLEKMDELHLTKRNESIRTWLVHDQSEWFYET